MTVSAEGIVICDDVAFRRDGKRPQQALLTACWRQ